MTEEMEMTCFQIISSAGVAKSNYLLSIEEAKGGRFDEARAMIKEGDEMMVVAHEPHQKLLAWEAQGRTDIVCLLLIHAEDQMMSCELCRQFALEFIELYEKLGTSLS